MAPLNPTPELRQTRRRHRLVLLALWLVFYGSFTLFWPPLLDDADSVHAEVAREMLLRHDYVTLYANGIRYLEKAPLFYWTMAGCFRVFGATTAASRLPLALSVLALAMLLESFARRMFGSARAGLYAGLITLSSFGIFIFSRINIPDVLVCVLLSAALFFLWQAEQDEVPRNWLCWAIAALCALDILTKGLIGVVFPVAIAVVYMVAVHGWTGVWARLRRLHPVSSTLVFLAIAVPWHVLAALANPAQGHPGAMAWINGHLAVPLPTDGNVHGWAWFYFINEQVLRYLNLRVPRDYDTVPLWLFLGLIAAWLLPWSVFLPRAVGRGLPLLDAEYRRRLLARALEAEERGRLFLVIWAALPLVFFLFSTRQEYYVLPSLPPLILLVAGLLGAVKTRQLRWESWTLLAGAALGSLLCLYFLVNTREPLPGTDLATLLTQNPADYALSFGHFLDLNARALGLFRVPLVLTPIALAVGTGGYAWLRARGQDVAAVAALAAGACVLLVASWCALVIFSPTLTSYQLAEAMKPVLRPGDLIVLHGEYEAGSTLGFYLQRADLHILEGRSSNLWYGSFFPDAPKIFETRASLAQEWHQPRRVFLWQDPSDKERPALSEQDLGGPMYVIASSGGKQILSNQP